MHFGFQSAFGFCCRLHFFTDKNIDGVMITSDELTGNVSVCQDHKISGAADKLSNPSEERRETHNSNKTGKTQYNKHNNNHNTHLSVKPDEWMN